MWIKLRFFLFIFFLFLSDSSFSSTLEVADSLYKDKKYTQAYDIYKILLENEKKTSPTMLLKMAYINEGLEDFSMTLYYLNLYYLLTFDQTVLTKMESLATKHDLKGYKIDDYEYLRTYYFKYREKIILIFFILAIAILISLIYVKFKKKKISPILHLFQFISLSILIYLINYDSHNSRSIINRNNVYMMKAPSSAAEIVTILNKGHRLKIEEKEDVWTKVIFNNDEVGYIKTSNLLDISLFQ